MLKSLLITPKIEALHRALGTAADLHIAGGAVRDALLGVKPKDIDLATKLQPQEVETLLSQAGIQFVVTGIRRGTITAVIETEPFEITTFRNPANEKEFTSSILEDLPARDFSINAMAFDLNTNELVDPYGGQTDLKNKILRCVGEPERRFIEDPHRILRMIRFGPGQGRAVEDETITAAAKLVPLLQDISIERVHDELCKILLTEFANVACSWMSTLGIFKIFIPELDLTVGVGQNKYHTADVFDHTLQVLQHTPADLQIRLAALFHDIGKPECRTEVEGEVKFLGHDDCGAEKTKAIMERLKFSTEDTRVTTWLVKEHMRSVEMGPKGMRKLIRDAGDLLPKWIALKQADSNSHRQKLPSEKWDSFFAGLDKEFKRETTTPFRKLAVNGDDLLALGLRQGPEIGRLLKLLDELVLEDPSKNTKEVLLVELKSLTERHFI